MTTGRSTPSLFGDAIEQVTDLFRSEMRLFRAEINDKISQATRAGSFIAVAGVLLIAALFLCLGAAVDGLSAATGLQRYWSGLIIGGIIAVVGVILLMKALSDLKPANLKPNRSIHQLQKDAAVAKAQVKL